MGSMIHSLDVIYHKGDLAITQDTKSEDDKNWTQLQATLQWRIIDITPQRLSLSTIESADPDLIALTLTINVRQSWAAVPRRPLTLCTATTILGENDPTIRVSMKCRNHENKFLLGDPLYGVHMRYAPPTSDDWKTEMPFATIPAGNAGLTITKSITYAQLRKASGFRAGGQIRPQPGETYELSFSPGRRELFTTWWNWGSLDEDLKDRKLVDMVDPRLNDIHDAPPPPPPILLPFASWEDNEDDDGNQIVRLLVHLDTTPVVVCFDE